MDVNPCGLLVDSAGERGTRSVMMTLLLAPLLPFIVLAFLLGAERFERGLDHPKKRRHSAPMT